MYEREFSVSMARFDHHRGSAMEFQYISHISWKIYIAAWILARKLFEEN